LGKNSPLAASASGMSGGTAATYQLHSFYSYSIPSSGGYDPAGNLKSVTDSVTGAWGYTYDTLNRLRTAIPSSGSYVGHQGCWSYDGFGNKTAENWQASACPSTEAGVTATAQYTSLNQVSWTSVNAAVNGFAYDAAGNVTNDNANAYLYDAEGRLCAVKNLTVGTMTGYVYDGEGARVAKGSLGSWSCNLSSNGFTLTNSYDVGLSGEQLSEVNSSGNWVHTNVFASGKLLATYAATGNDTYFALTDWLGSKRAEITPDGLVSTFFSLPYGNTLTSSGNASDATEHHFTGKERDSESNNDYFGARYYSSGMGRWMSPDPSMESEILETPQTWNRYSYVYNRPLYGTDPDGRCPPCVGALIGGAVGGAVGGFSEGLFSAVSQFKDGSIDWKKVGADAAGGAVSGAITGGIGGATGGLSLLADAGIGAGANAIGGEVTRLIEGKDSSASDVLSDAVAGYAGGTMGHIASDFVHIPAEPKAPNNLKNYLKMKKYNANLLRRNVAKGVQTGVGTVTATPPGHALSGIFWLVNLFGTPPPPPPTNSITIYVDSSGVQMCPECLGQKVNAGYPDWMEQHPN
jgi:RHS repeat-associated protein